MAEHINNQTPLSSGAHQWTWGPPRVIAKELATVGVRGQASYNVCVAGRPGRIDGMLRVAAASVELADAAMNALEAAIEDPVLTGAEVPWEDDHGHSGTHLVVVEYARSGPRTYGRSGTLRDCWQRYTLAVRDNVPG